MNERMITFNPLRSSGMPRVQYIKPEAMYSHISEIQTASWVLFPAYWQVNTLSYALKKRIFPSVSTYHLGHNKIEQTRALMAVAPNHIPQTLIAANTDAGLDEVRDRFDFPVIGKDVRSAQGKGVFLLKNRRDLKDYAADRETLYIQEQLPIDRDLRVVYVGDKVIASYWRIGDGTSHLNNVAQGGTICYSPVPLEALELVTGIAQELGIDHAGFDMALVDGHWYVLEFNVFFGTKGLSPLKLPVGLIIQDYLEGRARSLLTEVG